MFYEFDQNNSGGRFVTNDKLCQKLYIEADNVHEAISKAEESGCYWDGVNSGYDCPCCGDRWSQPYEPLDFLQERQVSCYSSVIEDWYKKYGKYEIVSEPIINKGIFNTKRIIGKVRFHSIEEYAQYIANEWGRWTNPSARIFYRDGSVKEIFAEEQD